MTSDRFCSSSIGDRNAVVPTLLFGGGNIVDGMIDIIVVLDYRRQNGEGGWVLLNKRAVYRGGDTRCLEARLPLTQQTRRRLGWAGAYAHGTTVALRESAVTGPTF